MKSVVWFVCSIHTSISFERHYRNNTIGYQVEYAGYHFGVPACLHQENPSALAGGWPNLSPLANLASHFSLAGLGPTSAMALQEQQVIQRNGK